MFAHVCLESGWGRGQGRGERRWDSSEPPGRPVAPVTARALRGAGRRGGARGPLGFGTAAGARGPGLRVPRVCRRGARTPAPRRPEEDFGGSVELAVSC